MPTENHTPAPGRPGVWPELVARTTPAQANPASAVTQAIARQARLAREHGAL
ncbi:hypothetical protein ACIPY2_17545 [Paenarthrobacter sp. NPDC089675]|uniref:hypothetical protein n=1 Tax=Paenarthrobacter sp. NPDC089675 TaxID=3364376 RepID=UPI0038160D2A